VEMTTCPCGEDRGRILGRNENTSPKSFPPCCSQSSLLTDFTLTKSDLKLVCNVNIVYGNFKSENSQDYAQKPQRNCTFMNSASGRFPSCCAANLQCRGWWALAPPVAPSGPGGKRFTRCHI
jgi:hypothetical protein